MNVINITPYSYPRRNSVLIGENCLDRRVVKSPNKDLQIINPYQSFDDVVEAADFCWVVSLKHCDYLGELLNSAFGVSFAPSYWKVVLLPWLVNFVQIFYDRYLRLCVVRKDFPQAVIEIPKIELLGPLYTMSSDVWRQSYKHVPNIKLYSFLIKSMGLNSKVKYLDINLDEPLQTNISLGLKQALRRLYKSINFHSGDNLFLWYNEKPGDILKLSRELGGFQWGVPFIKEEGFCRKTLDRNKIRFNSTVGEFEEILNKIMPLAFPVSLFEEFQARRNEVVSFLNRKRIRTIFTSEFLYLNDTEKILLGEIKERGGRIIGRQHGGAGYGCSLIVLQERIERTISNYFITWGWDDGDFCPTVALPILHLSKMVDAHTKRNNKILFIGSQPPMYMYNYQDYWMPEFINSKYFNMKDIFLKNLNEFARREILYKPYLAEYGWNEKERIREMFPQVCFFESGSATKGMKNCSLVVIDHPSTSFLEALLMNVPTVIYWDITQHRLREEAKKYFQLLKEEGILYHDPIEAAAKVNEIASNPDIWWKSSIVQIARQKFCRRYAWADSNWKEIWSSTFRPIINS